MFAPLLALLVLPGSIFLDGAPAPTHLTEDTLANVVYVVAGPSTGTAFLLRHEKRRYLVTARHVVQPHLEDPGVPAQFHVGGKRGRPIREVRLFRVGIRADVAIFTFEDDAEHPYFPPGAGLEADAALHLASQVFLIGYPASLRQTYGSSRLRVVGGWVAGLCKYVPGSTVEYVDIDMPGVEHGHSGGPILLLPDRVVAIAVQRRTGSISRTIGATYAVPIKYVTALIDDTPVEEDVSALNETLRGTALVCGLSLQGKTDYDVWVQRVHRETGEPIWGESGIAVASSSHPEAAYRTVPSLADSTLVVHTIEQPGGGDADIMVQRISRYGELLYESGVSSIPVAGTTLREERPDAVADGMGGAIVVFERHHEGGDVDVVAQRVDASGEEAWTSEGVAVASAKARETSPRAVADGTGGAIVVFERRLPTGGMDLAAQRIDPDGALAWLGGARSVDLAASSEAELRPRAVPDGEGGAIVIYEVLDAEGHCRIEAQRLSHHGEALWNGGRPVVVSALATPPGATSVAAVSDERGGAMIAFEVVTDSAHPDDVDIAVQWIGKDGTLRWGRREGQGPVLPLLAASSRFAERDPVLCTDGQGGVVVGFVSGSENGDTDVWAQRVAADGTLVWNRGQRSAEVSLTFLVEDRVRILERHGDRVLFAFEIERDAGRRGVACQALDLERGDPVYGGGKVPLLVVHPGDGDTGFHLGARRR